MPFLAQLAVIAALYLFASSVAAEEAINVVCSAAMPWCEAVAAAFVQETGIKVNLTLKDAADALTQLAGEKAEPKHDVWYAGAGDRHVQAAEADLTDEYASPLVAQLRDWAVRLAEQSKGRSVGLYAAALGIGYNTKMLARKHLSEPRCWTDLARPEYHDDVQIANPLSSSGAYVTLATLVQVFGEDKAFELLKGVHRNVKLYPRAVNGPIRAVARGETAIGVAFLHDVATEIANGFPVGLAVPCEGTGYEVGAMSVVRGAPHPAHARRFYDWALSPATQRIAFEAKQFHVPSNRGTPIEPAVPGWGEPKLIAYDVAKHGGRAERNRLLEKWEREVHALPR